MVFPPFRGGSRCTLRLVSSRLVSSRLGSARLGSARLVASICALVALASNSFAQFGNAWLTFVKDQSRIVDASGASAAYILNDTEEKDYAWGDVNHDGWIDLVVVRKQPFTTPGKRVNYLLLNENGKLVDRTAQYATASSVLGDMGFLTPTNDRDVAVADLDGDGWVDIVTATTLGLNSESKDLTHPRIYRNLGSVGGTWQGFIYESARIPQLYDIPSGNPQTPNFCSVSVGDVTGDGCPDLYFSNYELGLPTLHNRLLTNNGAGFFVDSLETRMSPTMLNAGFGTSSEILDINGDGVNDVLRGGAIGTTAVLYNNPANIGFFNVSQTSVSPGSTYHVDAGDLNADGKPDLIFGTDGGMNACKYNLGTDSLGRAIWSAPFVVANVSGFAPGVSGNCTIVDLNGDGFGDAVFNGVDVDAVDTTRRGYICHNPGGAVGSTPSLTEEAQQAGLGGWLGAVGLLVADLSGTFDTAVLDIDNDGDPDLVIGSAAGTGVFINQMLQPSQVVCSGDGSGTQCPCNNNSAAGSGSGCLSSLTFGGMLRSSGAARTTADSLKLLVTQVPNGAGQYFQSTSIQSSSAGAGIVNGDGLLCAAGTIVRLGIKFASGNASSYPQTGDPTVSVQGMTAAGDIRSYQVWYRDADLSFCTNAVFNYTNAITLTWQP